MPYKELKFELSDFGHSDATFLDREQAMNLANRAIENRLTDCPRVYGMIFCDGHPSYKWYKKSWAGATGKSTHFAYLTGIQRYRDG